MRETAEKDLELGGPETLFEKLADKLGVTVRASTVYGDPIERDARDLDRDRSAGGALRARFGKTPGLSPPGSAGVPPAY